MLLYVFEDAHSRLKSFYLVLLEPSSFYVLKCWCGSNWSQVDENFVLKTLMMNTICAIS